jgi:hypothetical protein
MPAIFDEVNDKVGDKVGSGASLMRPWCWGVRDHFAFTFDEKFA